MNDGGRWAPRAIYSAEAASDRRAMSIICSAISAGLLTSANIPAPPTTSGMRAGQAMEYLIDVLADAGWTYKIPLELPYSRIFSPLRFSAGCHETCYLKSYASGHDLPYPIDNFKPSAPMAGGPR